MTEFNINNINKNKLEIKLKGINNIISMHNMFFDCKLLESLPDIHYWNTSKVIDMRFIFYNCNSL